MVTKIRATIPDVALSTDLIVGFPGETEEDYLATRRLLEDVRYHSAFLFAYSERSGTYGARHLDDAIPPDVKQRRLAELIAMQLEISKEIYTSRIGERVAVLFEGHSRRDPNDAIGNTADFKTTVFPAQGYRPGDLVEVEISGASSHTLRGNAVRLLSSSRVEMRVRDSLTRGISIGAAH